MLLLIVMAKTPLRFAELAQTLKPLGFSDLEASIYVFLCQESSITAYRIAQGLAKPVANTYKAINALESSGAVIVEEGESRLYRAVPFQELFKRMEHTLRERGALAAAALAEIRQPIADDRVYRLQGWDQIIERAKQMLARAEQVVIVNASPGFLSEIRDDLASAANRGIGVLLKAYEPVDIEGAVVALSNESRFIAEHFPVQELNLVVDATEGLQAFVDNLSGTVIQAIWTGSVFLAFNQYMGVLSEWHLTRFRRQVLEGVSLAGLNAQFDSAYPLMQTPGYHKLLGLFQQNTEGER
jgi:sugar-specific transcriptional regulator TrmB